MTKKEQLVWRLKEKPTVSEVTELMTQQIITKEEAREILFNTKTPEDKDVDALKKQIEFLEGLVKELSKVQHITSYPVYIEKYIDRWVPRLPQPIWYSNGISMTSTAQGGSTNLASYSNNLLN